MDSRLRGNDTGLSGMSEVLANRMSVLGAGAPSFLCADFAELVGDTPAWDPTTTPADWGTYHAAAGDDTVRLALDGEHGLQVLVHWRQEPVPAGDEVIIKTGSNFGQIRQRIHGYRTTWRLVYPLAKSADLEILTYIAGVINYKANAGLTTNPVYFRPASPSTTTKKIEDVVVGWADVSASVRNDHKVQGYRIEVVLEEKALRTGLVQRTGAAGSITPWRWYTPALDGTTPEDEAGAE